MAKQQFGVIGMAVMGQNLALNVESKGFSVAVYNRTGSKTETFVRERCAGRNILGTYTIEEFVDALEQPRRIMIMVKAGEAVDDFISQLRPRLSAGDVLIDGGNSYYKDTDRRLKDLEKNGILYIGTGVSGGEEGALRGPCIMPGGQPKAYRLVEPIFTMIAAQTEDGPCCAYIGPGGAGHYVKMVHNGIEYGDMQLIAETYDIMRSALKMSAGEIGEVFGKWREGELSSYLMDITEDIFKVHDPETARPLVDLILDKAGQKGTGKWTSQDALDIGVPIPTINAAVEARILSAYKAERVEAAKVVRGPKSEFRGDRDRFLERLHDALYAAKIISYAQGMALLKAASSECGFDLRLWEIAQIWKGGCIIRARLLDPIKKALKRKPANLMLAPTFRRILNRNHRSLRIVVQTAQKFGVPCLAMAASLGYYDSYRKENLPANLTQAQRDYFGAHTYQRTDTEGTFHTEWTKLVQVASGKA